MNTKAVITALQPLEGHHILILTNAKPHGFVHGQPCVRVYHLPPDQRQHSNQGNIILWDGRFTSQGLQSGGTLWANRIQVITWNYDPVAHIHTCDGITVSIIKLWKLSGVCK